MSGQYRSSLPLHVVLKLYLKITVIMYSLSEVILTLLNHKNKTKPHKATETLKIR